MSRKKNTDRPYLNAICATAPRWSDFRQKSGVFNESKKDPKKLRRENRRALRHNDGEFLFAKNA